MDPLAVSGIQLSPARHFDRIVDIRAEKREHLRGRNNVTTCRSPTREFDTRLIKNELKEKRHLEFLRRRSVSPEPCDLNSSRRKHSPNTFSMKHHSSTSKLGTMYTHFQNAPNTNGRRPMVNITPNSSKTDGPSTSNWASLWSEQVSLMKQEKGHARKQASTSTTVIKESNQYRTKSADKRENNINAPKTSNITVQTESGFVVIKESDLERLSDYLQEALWREEALKEKLAALQESTSGLITSSNNIWTARCTEDLLRNQIKALEAQLQVCLQKFPKDEVKKLLIQMEKEKLVYEERAVVALQKITQEKSEALSKAETMQEALRLAKVEALRWQRLCEELKLRAGQLRENQHLSDEQLQQMHSQLELSRSREAELREELLSLKQEKKELQYNICLLEEDNQVLREEIQHLRDGSNESQDFMVQGRLTSEEAEPRPTSRRDSQKEEQLRHTQEKLRVKERECEELQTELCAMEQECQSSQARLSQCRDELRQLSRRRRRPMLCVSRWTTCLFFLLVLTLAAVALLWLWHPPFREKAEDLYSDIETRITDYLMNMASPQHSGCFRPI